LYDRAIRKQEDDKRRQERRIRHATDDLRYALKKTAIEIHHSFEDAVPLMQDLPEFKALADNEQAQRAAWTKHIRRLKEKARDSRENHRDLHRDRDAMSDDGDRDKPRDRDDGHRGKPRDERERGKPMRRDDRDRDRVDRERRVSDAALVGEYSRSRSKREREEEAEPDSYTRDDKVRSLLSSWTSLTLFVKRARTGGTPDPVRHAGGESPEEGEI
jgi:pre-mRNA-processing factor 40